jgi:hypothetical protein
MKYFACLCYDHPHCLLIVQSPICI